MGYVKIYSSDEDGYCTTTVGPYKTQTTMKIGAESSDSQDDDSAEWHAFMFFDTSVIPIGAKILKANLGIRFVSAAGDTTALRAYFYIGDNYAGSTLEKADYDDVVGSGQYFGQISAGSRPGWFDLPITSSVDLAEISRANTTNVEIDAHWVGPIESATEQFFATVDHGTSSYWPYLEVWYRLNSPRVY